MKETWLITFIRKRRFHPGFFGVFAFTFILFQWGVLSKNIAIEGEKKPVQEYKKMISMTMDSPDSKLSNIQRESATQGKLREGQYKQADKKNDAPTTDSVKHIVFGVVIGFIIFPIIELFTVVLLIMWKRRRNLHSYGQAPYNEESDVMVRLGAISLKLDMVSQKQHQIFQLLTAAHKPDKPAIPSLKSPADEDRLFMSTEGYFPEFKPRELSPLEELLSLYNAGLNGEKERSQFRKRYMAITRIGVINAMERRRDSSIKPIFKTAPDGDFFAVEIMIDGIKKFTVVPRFDFSLQEANFGPGAIGMVFHCQGYDPKKTNRRFRLVKPAFFSSSSRENWDLLEPGEIAIETDI